MNLRLPFRHRPCRRPLAHALITFAALGLLSFGVTAATFTVTNINDSGAGSLRQAVLDANDAPGADTVQFGGGSAGIMNINSTIEITDDLTITGNSTTTVNGDFSGSIFKIPAPADDLFAEVTDPIRVSLSGFQIANGETAIENLGAALTVANLTVRSASAYGIKVDGEQASLDLSNSRLSGISSHSIVGLNGSATTVTDSEITGSGSAHFRYSDTTADIRNTLFTKTRLDIRDGANLSLTQSAVSDNASTCYEDCRGGGLFLDAASARITDTTFENNRMESSWGDNQGGAVWMRGATLMLINSTLSNNSANYIYSANTQGGAIWMDGSTLTLINSTLSNNHVDGGEMASGGAFFATNSSILNIYNTTITGNIAANKGGAVYLNDEGTQLAIANSILVGNHAAAETDPGHEVYVRAGFFDSIGHNLFGANGDPGLYNVTSNASDLVLAGAPSSVLEPLADNGGPTQTHLLVTGGPALDAGDNGLTDPSYTNDQRGPGFPRILNGTVDIGAVEGTGSDAVDTYALTVSKTGMGEITSSPSGIDCGANCSASFAQDTSVSLTAVPDSDWQFSGWSGACSGTGACNLTMTSDQNVSATFSQATATMQTISVSLSGSGTVTSSPDGIDCGADCTASFTTGTSLILTATPDTGATFTGWGGACTGTSSTCTVTLNSGISVLANFATETPEPTDNPLSVIVNGPGTVTGPSIDCGSDCTEDFDASTTVTLTATPDNGATFTGWGGACSGTSVSCTLSMDAARSVMATFETGSTGVDQPLTVAVTGPGSVTSAPSGILCGFDCEADFAAGTQVTLTALPNLDSTFVGWSGACSGNTANCTVTMDQARDVQAQFSALSVDDLSLAVNIVGQGQIESSPAGIDCTGLCLGRFPSGSALTLTATAEEGWTFTGWQGACAGSSATCSLNLISPTAVTATFEPEVIQGEETLDVIIVGLGGVTSSPSGIDCDSDCQESYLQGTSVTLTATADTGNAFIGWGGACAAQDTATTCTLTMDRAQLAVAAFGGITVDRESTAWQVAEIYMATLGYAPDDEGLQYWVRNIDLLPQWTPETVAQSFFDQPLVQEVYPSTMSNREFIDELYRNIYGRGADAGGMAYWLQQLDNGQIARNQMVIAMINGGWDNNSPDALSDMQRFGYRIDVALEFADYQAINGIVYGQLSEENQAYLRQVGRDILLGVTTDESTRDAAIDSIPVLLGPLVN